MSQTLMSCCCFTGDKSTSLQWLIITSFWFFTPPKDVTIHILANVGPSVAFPGRGEHLASSPETDREYWESLGQFLLHCL